MRRSLMIVPVLAAGLAIGLAMPAWAQQTSDQAAWQAADSVVQTHNKASQKKDAAEVASLYTEDVVMVTLNGPVVGRDAVQKMYADNFKVFTPEPAKLDRVVLLGDAVRFRTGTWSGSFQGPEGPVHAKGNWATTDVRNGDTWKIRMETFNLTPTPAQAEAAK